MTATATPTASGEGTTIDLSSPAETGTVQKFHVTITSRAWLLPLFLLLAIVTALGVGLWLSALNVAYRDIGYILPFLTQFWLFATPVAYSASVISQKWQLVYSLNPMAGVVNGFRWSLLGAGNGPDLALWVSVGISIFIFISGLFYFRSMEKTFADTI